MKQLVLLCGILISSTICLAASPEAPVQDLDKILDKEVEKVLSQDMPEKKFVAESEIPITQPKKVLESEIPVLTDKKVLKESKNSPYTRLILSLVVIAFFGAAMTMASRWWRKRTTKSASNNKIRLITQHFLGPRKSLAIVRVAGENMLIGVTDHNINMIKSLSLLDEESMDSIDPTKSFGEILETSTSKVKEEKEDFAFAEIKDRISTKMSGMRQL